MRLLSTFLEQGWFQVAFYDVFSQVAFNLIVAARKKVLKTQFFVQNAALFMV